MHNTHYTKLKWLRNAHYSKKVAADTNFKCTLEFAMIEEN